MNAAKRSPFCAELVKGKQTAGFKENAGVENGFPPVGAFKIPTEVFSQVGREANLLALCVFSSSFFDAG